MIERSSPEFANPEIRHNVEFSLHTILVRQYDRFERVFLKFGAVVDLRHLHSKNIGGGEYPDLFDMEQQEFALSMKHTNPIPQCLR